MARSLRTAAYSVSTLALCMVAQVAQAQNAPTGESDRARIERLEATVAELTRRLNEQSQKTDAAAQTAAQASAQAQQVQQAQQAAPVAAAVPKPQRQSDNNLEVYGFAQVDAIQDFKRVNPNWDATLRPSRIPTTKGQYGSDGQTVFSVRQSRLGVKASGTVADKPYEAKFEFDIYGVGVDEGQTTMRVRHMYGKWGPILAGQTNSLFMDGDLFPNVVDYWGPAGMVFVRTPQVRYTFADDETWLAAVALEHPSDDIDAGAIRLIDPSIATNLKPDEELPDFTAQFQYRGDWGHVTLAGIARKVGYDTVGTPGNDPKGSKFGWGLNGAAIVKFNPATFRLGVVYGKGIASYMNDGGMDLAPNARLVPATPTVPPTPTPPMNLILAAETVPLLGVTAYVDLQWSKTLSSSIGYSFTKVDNTNFQDPTAFHKGEYASGNLLWAPIDRILTGVEVLWGRRTDNNGAKGDDARAQFTFKVSFSSKDIWGD